MAQTTETRSAPERRRFRRIGTRIEGRVVFAGVDADCLIHEMSAAGAIIEVSPRPKAGTPIALDVPGVGFTLGHARRHLADGLLSVELPAEETQTGRFADRLILAAFRNPPE
ncbi:MAG: hypothetical protein GC184_13530 [Rhizobiales bacterium]|nr:hypothetical protein [Hyphomicrobiales bacterium]